MVPNLLLIEAPPENWHGQPATVLASAAAVQKRMIEHAGHAFELLWLTKYGNCGDSSMIDASNTAPDTILDENDAGRTYEVSYDVDKGDLYALLGLSDCNVRATDVQIRKAYRQVSLRYHPDKHSGSIGQDRAEALFKSIQAANETLSDVKRRRTYDSTLPFDNSLPESNQIKKEVDFFRVLEPYFARNSQFSIVQPMPSLGDNESEMEQVDKFYNAWYGFKSWREFAADDEYDVEDAESREERRWMERQNDRMQSQLKKKEAARIRRLVDMAFDADPRVKRLREEEKRKRKERKQLKMKSKQAEEETVRKTEEERREREKREEEETKLKASQEKKARENQKRQARKCRQLIRKAYRESSLVERIEEADLDAMFKDMTEEEVATLSVNVQSNPDALEARVRAYLGHDAAQVDEAAARRKSELEAQEKALERQREEEERLRREEEERKRTLEWTTQELSALAKGIAKFPGGTPERWEKISEVVGTRNVDEIINKAKEVKKKTKADAVASTTIGGGDAFSAFKNNVRLKNDRRGSNASDDEAFRESNTNSTPLEIPSNDVENDGWSAEQQTAFEAALRSVPKNAEDRWGDISKLVIGKSKKQCRQRFKLLREMLKQRQA